MHPSCALGHHEPESSSLSAQELKEHLEEGTELVLVDIRETMELAEMPLPLKNVHHIPCSTLEEHITEFDRWREQTIVLICYSGSRADFVAQLLTDRGFPKIKVLSGGMLAWNRKNSN